jgi:GNAT superfamily N-acetyltransferase
MTTATPTLGDAAAQDAASAVACITRAFDADPLMAAFFPGAAVDRAARITAFMSVIFGARLAIRAPCLVARDDGRIVGVAMGNAPDTPEWPAPIKARWDAFAAAVPGLEQAFEAYDRATAPFVLAARHHYLGVLAVDPDAQGGGLGGRLVEAFCARADRDPDSAGVMLDTAAPANLHWYSRFGFTLRGSGPVGTATVWTLFRPRAGHDPLTPPAATA